MTEKIKTVLFRLIGTGFKKIAPSTYAEINKIVGWEKMPEREALADLAQRIIKEGPDKGVRLYKSYPFNTGTLFIGGGRLDTLKALIEQMGYTYNTFTSGPETVCAQDLRKI